MASKTPSHNTLVLSKLPCLSSATVSLWPPGLHGHLEGGQGTSLTYSLQMMTVMVPEGG